MSFMRLALLSRHNIPSIPSAWDHWRDHIMTKRDIYGFQQSAIIRTDNGLTQSATSGFSLPVREVTVIGSLLSGDLNNDRITIRGKTFMLKNVSEGQLLGFNGSRFCVICKSNMFYLVVVGKSHDKHCQGDAVTWLTKLANQLVLKKF